MATGIAMGWWVRGEGSVVVVVIVMVVAVIAVMVVILLGRYKEERQRKARGQGTSERVPDQTRLRNGRLLLKPLLMTVED